MFALDNIDVVSLENGVSAPLCTRYLGDLGANVVKIERPGVGDVHRQWDSVVDGNSSAHVWLDRNKRSVELNLKEADGRSLFLELAERADVVVQNFRPGTVDQLGVDYSTVREWNDDVVYLNVSGYGQDGPYRDRKAYDLVMQGETGLIRMTGTPESPAKIPISLCDINAAMYGVFGVLTSLYHRERTGEGQEVAVNMFGGILSWLGYLPHKYWHNDEVPDRMGMRHHLLTPYGPFRTASDEYVNFAVLSDAHWEQFCHDVIEQPDLAADPAYETNAKRIENREALEAIVAEAIEQHPKEYWIERLEAVGIPWGDVNAIDDVLSHPQTEALGLIRELDTDDGPIPIVDNPLELDTLDIRRDPMPDLGEHTDDVLADLGLTPGEIESLRANDVI
jgi:crotonobetainyl-CoA:carnitine CoA-transferase CaiB-like acyl-CoA transferase